MGVHCHQGTRILVESGLVLRHAPKQAGTHVAAQVRMSKLPSLKRPKKTALVPRLAYGCVGAGMAVVPLITLPTGCSDDAGAHIDPAMTFDSGFDADAADDAGDAAATGTPDASGG